MKNIQVIDSALNCTYDVFAIDDSLFEEIFPDNQDIEFIEDFFARVGETRAKEILDQLWSSRQDKKSIVGIHGTLFYGLISEKKRFYPTKKESEMVVVIPGS